MDYKKFINKAFFNINDELFRIFRKSPHNMSRLVYFLKNIDEPDFPLLN